jgi:sulfate permease, SulP family
LPDPRTRHEQYVNSLRRFLPFLAWFPVTRETLRADFLAGLAVALVLIPQSMAYAQLAGMPAYYGLYAAFLPVLVGALWGSSRNLPRSAPTRSCRSPSCSP